MQQEYFLKRPKGCNLPMLTSYSFVQIHCTRSIRKYRGGNRYSVAHIADATAEVLIDEGVKLVGLLGTAFRTVQSFYKGGLKERDDLNFLVPHEQDIYRFNLSHRDLENLLA